MDQRVYEKVGEEGGQLVPPPAANLAVCLDGAPMSLPAREGIPRLLHYVLLTPPPRPHSVDEAYHFWITSCARENPDFQIVLWATEDCERLAAGQPPSIASLYHNFSRLEDGRGHGKSVIRQADFCRVLVLERFGGIYIDMDVLCVRPFSSLVRDESLSLFAAEEPTEHKQRWKAALFPGNAVLGSTARHPLWTVVLRLMQQRCVGWDPNSGARAPLACRLTGPHMLAEAWTRYVEQSCLRRRLPKAVARTCSPTDDLRQSSSITLLPTPSFYPLPARVERARAFDKPRSYRVPTGGKYAPNVTIAAHQWGHFYSSGRLKALQQRVPLPPVVHTPSEIFGERVGRPFQSEPVQRRLASAAMEDRLEAELIYNCTALTGRYRALSHAGEFRTGEVQRQSRSPEAKLLSAIARAARSAPSPADRHALTPAGPLSRALMMVDVGANVGDFTSMILAAFGPPRGEPSPSSSSPAVHLHAFELVPSNVELLRKRFRADSPSAAAAAQSRVTVHHAAVTDNAGGTVEIKGRRAWKTHLDPRVVKGTSLIGGRRPQGGEPLDTTLGTAPTVTLDGILGYRLGDAGGPPVAILLLKVDAEGADGRVLRGARRLLDSGRVAVVYFESNPMQSALNDSLRKNVEYLSARAAGGCTSYLFGKRHVLPLPHACAGSALLAAPSGGRDRSSRRRIDAENVVSFCGSAGRHFKEEVMREFVEIT